MRTVIGIALLILGIVGALYIGVWWGIVEPIINIAEAVDNDAVTASLIAWEVCKFFLKEIFASLFAYVCFTLGMGIMTNFGRL